MTTAFPVNPASFLLREIFCCCVARFVSAVPVMFHALFRGASRPIMRYQVYDVTCQYLHSALADISRAVGLY